MEGGPPLAVYFDRTFDRDETEEIRLYLQGGDKRVTALAELRPEEKEVFLLRQNANLTYEEIALICRSPVGTVKTQMRSALQKLRDQLR